MTSIPVKDVGSVFVNSVKAQRSGNVSASGDFQAIFSAQTSKGMESGVQQNNVNAKAQPRETENVNKESETESTAKVEAPDKTGETDPVKTPQTGEATGDAKALTEEELEAAMEVLGTAAFAMMQKIADVFGISMEELQAAMDTLGMEQTDVLDATKLGELLLQLSGSADSYALVTDEVLYNNFRQLMGNLDEVLAECQETLGMDAEQINELLRQMSEQSVVQEEATTEASLAEVSEDVADTDVEDGTDTEANDDVTVQTPETQDVEVKEAGRENNAQAGSGEKRNEGEDVAENAVHRGVEFTIRNAGVENFANQIQQTATTYVDSPWDVQTRDIMNQIMDHMKLQLTAETQTLEMQLHPASLGTLQVSVASKGGVITANFITENEAVKAALESQMIQLKESFAEQGVKVEAIEVTVQTHGFERNLDQGRGRNNEQETPKRNRTRRINLDDALSMNDMEEEDVIAAEMMAASGSTVDYTV